MEGKLMDHLDHKWEQVGRCVYCSCGMRLYQGKVPKTPDDKREFASALDSMIEAALRRM